MSRRNKKISKALLGTVTSMSLLGGCAIDNRTNDDVNVISEVAVDGDMVVDIDSSYKESLSKATGKDIDYNYTVNDLKEIGPVLDIKISGNASLDWVNYCNNVESLLIYLDDDGVKDVLKDIKKMDKLSSFDLVNYNGTFFDSEDLAFLNKDKITKLFLYGNLIIEQDFLSNFSNLEFLSFYGDSAFNFNVAEIEKMDKLDCLFLGNTPYTTAIYVDEFDYNKLISKGIGVIFSGTNNADKFLKASKVLDDIASSLELDSDISDEEKLKRIILYVLDNFEYSSEIRESLKNGESPDPSRFYDGGYLKGIVEGDGNIVCGNYAAIVGALVNRSGMKSYILKSINHAYNLVCVDEEYYYVDATGLDALNYRNADADFVRNILRSDDSSNLEWYMKKYQTNEEMDDMYSFLNTSYNDVDSMILDVSDCKYTIKIDDDRLIINGAVLVGILFGIGHVQRVHNRNINKDRNRGRSK